jgi:hypothetical protein
VIELANVVIQKKCPGKVGEGKEAKPCKGTLRFVIRNGGVPRKAVPATCVECGQRAHMEPSDIENEMFRNSVRVT